MTPARPATLTTFEIRIDGIPAPKGSYRAVPHRKTGHAVLINDAKGGKAWADEMTLKLQQAYHDEPLDGPLMVQVTFYLPQPKDRRRVQHTVRPDLDKLVRNCLDALVKARVIVDDGRVVDIHARKWYAIRNEVPGVRIAVTPTVNI